MTTLVRPDVRLRPSWAAAVGEFGSETIHGSGAWLGGGGPLDLTEAGCAAFVAMVSRCADADVELAAGRVPCDYYWIVEEPDEVVGFLALRHRLDAWLLEQGGHIGYSVRPSHRRRGHASRALALGVRRAAELGLDRVLVTCDEPNLASRRTIERGGGVYEDTRNGKRRYWIATGLSAGRPAQDGRTAAPA